MTNSELKRMLEGMEYEPNLTDLNKHIIAHMLSEEDKFAFYKVTSKAAYYRAMKKLCPNKVLPGQTYLNYLLALETPRDRAERLIDTKDIEAKFVDSSILTPIYREKLKALVDNYEFIEVEYKETVRNVSYDHKKTGITIKSQIRKLNKGISPELLKVLYATTS